MHHTDIKYKDISFKSAEHMYQYYKCTQLSQNNLADEVKEAITSMIAKNLASTITNTSKWTNHSIPVMRVVLQAKAGSCPEFKSVLVNSGNSLFVQATDDKFWGCGILSTTNVASTLPSYYKGKNMLGELMMELREKLIKELTKQSNEDIPSPLSFIRSLPDSLHIAPIQPQNEHKVSNYSQIATNKKTLNQIQSITLENLLQIPLSNNPIQHSFILRV